MSDSTKNSNIEAGGQNDPLVDSLLRQFADTQGEANEDFLTNVERAIDESEIIVPIARSHKWKKSLAWAGGIAAVIAIGFSGWFSAVKNEPPKGWVSHSEYSTGGKEIVHSVAASTGRSEETNGFSTETNIAFDDIRFSTKEDLSFVHGAKPGTELNLSEVGKPTGMILFGTNESKIDSMDDFLEFTERRWAITGENSSDRRATSISGLAPVDGNINVQAGADISMPGASTSDGSGNSSPGYAQMGSGDYDSSKRADSNVSGTGSVINERESGRDAKPAVIGYRDSSSTRGLNPTVTGVAVSADKKGYDSFDYESGARMKTPTKSDASSTAAKSKSEFRNTQPGHEGRSAGKVTLTDSESKVLVYGGRKSDGLAVTVPPPTSVAKPSNTVVTAGGRIALGVGGNMNGPEGGPNTVGDSLDTSVDDIAKKPAVASLIAPAQSKMMFGQKEALPSQTSLATTLGRSPSHSTGVGIAPNPVESGSTRYGALIDNAWTSPLNDPLSTFSIDVDTASWTNVRGMIRSGITADQIPNDSVRIEEMINYFDWDYSQPKGDHPFAFAVEEAACPWNADNRLLRVGIQGLEAPKRKRPDANLVFLLDVSGSMNQSNKLPLVKKAISILVEELDENDRVTMVVYAGAEGVALPPTSGRNQATISAALRKLNAGGSTNGGAGIKLAYKLAAEQFIKDGINRVILCTDGDFNVGLTGNDELVKMVERKAKSGVFLSVCGFGQDNLNDSMLEKITNKGNGNYFFIDTPREARKVFLKDMMGTLLTIAKDVKIQMEFNPAKVAAYRLIGYANRRLNAEDFENDKVDAGEVGSGHSVTALYEVIPVGSENDPRSKVTSNLRYQKEVAPPKPEPKREIIPSDELALLKLRYKRPNEEVSILMEQAIMPSGKNIKAASKDYQFASAVALFGMILREHDSAKGQGIGDVLKLAEKGMGNDPHGYRAEFVKMVRKLKVADKE